MKKIFFVLAVLLAGAVSFSESVELSIDDAVDCALKNSKSLKSSDIDLEMKKRAADTSWNVFLPNVSVNGTLNRSNKSNYGTIVNSIGQAAVFGSGGDPLGWTLYQNREALAKEAGYEDNETAHWSTVGGLSASWNFSLAYISQIQAAKAAYEGQKITWEQNLKETEVNVKKLFYALLLQQENLKIQEASLENARQRMVQAEANFKNGLVPEISLLQTQVSYENTKPTVESARQALNQQFDTFAFILGLPVGTEITLKGTIEPNYVEVDTDELLEKYGDRDLDIRSLENTIQTVKIGLNAVNFSTWSPALAVNFGFQPVYTGVNAFKFFGDIGDTGKWTDNGSLSLTLAWNLANMLPWSSNRQQAKDYKQNLEKLELNLALLKENQKVQVRKAVDTLTQAKDQIESMERSVQLAQKAYDMQLKSYRNGTTELLDLRDAENSLNQAKLAQLNQKYQYISALMDLEKTLNVSLSEKN